MYVVNAAADVLGDKVNYVLEFPYPPSFAELVARCENVFGRARGADFVVFSIQRFHDDPVGARWVSVTGVADLFRACQLYVFDEASWQNNIQKPIPPPVHPPCPDAAAPVPAAPSVSPSPAMPPLYRPVALPTTTIPSPPPLKRASVDVPNAALNLSVTPVVGTVGGGAVGVGGLRYAAATPAAPLPLAEPVASTPQLGDPHGRRSVTSYASLGLPPADVLDAARATPLSLQVPAPSPAAAVAAAPLPITAAAAAPAVLPSPIEPTTALAAPLSIPAAADPASLAVPFATDPQVTRPEKVAYTYKNVANRYTGVVRQEDFLAACAQLSLPLSANTVASIFRRCDRDKDDLLSVDEWRWMCEMHPAVLESLYFRVRDGEDAAALQERLGEAEVQLSVFLAKEQTTAVALQTAAAAASAQDLRLSQQGARLAEKTTTLRHQEDAALALDEAVRRAETEVRIRENEAKLCAERERQLAEDAEEAAAAALRAQAFLDDKRHIALHTVQSLALREEELVGRTDHIAKLQEQNKVMLESRSEIKASLFAEEGNIPTKARRVADTLAVCDASVNATTSVEAMEGDAVRRVRDLAEEVAAAERQRTREADNYADAMRRAAEMEHAVASAHADVQTVQKQVTQLREEHAAYTHRRRVVEQQEKPLLEEELRLRQQRDLLALRHQETREHTPGPRSPPCRTHIHTTAHYSP